MKYSPPQTFSSDHDSRTPTIITIEFRTMGYYIYYELHPDDQ